MQLLSIACAVCSIQSNKLRQVNRQCLAGMMCLNLLDRALVPCKG